MCIGRGGSLAPLSRLAAGVFSVRPCNHGSQRNHLPWRDVEAVMKATKRIMGLLLTAMVLSACARSSPPGGGESGNISSSVPSGAGAGNAPRLVTPVSGLRDVHPIRWSKVTPAPDERSLTVAFWSEPCSAVDHVGLAEKADRVVVTLYVGTSPSEENQPCVQAAEYLGVKIPLSSPLGNRRVVDGTSAAGRGPSGPGTSVSPSRP
jgi:hypothetical protein